MGAIPSASPEFFDAYCGFSSVPGSRAPLAPKIKELIYIAIDAATTHLYLPGLRRHIRNALGHGATVAEIMEVLQLTCVLGIHTITEGVPALLEEAKRAGRRLRSPRQSTGTIAAIGAVQTAALWIWCRRLFGFGVSQAPDGQARSRRRVRHVPSPAVPVRLQIETCSVKVTLVIGEWTDQHEPGWQQIG